MGMENGLKLRNIYLVNWFRTILTNPVRVHSARKLWKEKKVSYSRPDVCNWQRWLNNRSWVDIFRREMFKWIRIDSSDAVLVASHSRDVGRSKNLGGLMVIQGFLKEWYLVSWIVLTYCEKKNVLVIEKNF